MSETTAEVLVSTLTDLLQVVVWAGLAAGLLLLWRPRLARRLTLVQAGLAAAIAVCLIPFLWTQNWSAIVEFVASPAFGSETTTGIRFAHGIDVLSALMLFAATVPFLLTAAHSGGEAESAVSDVIRYLFLQTLLQFVLADDTLLRIAFLPLMSLCCLFRRVCDATATTGEVVAARRTFLFRSAGDGMLLMAIALLRLSGSLEGEHAAAAGTLLWAGVLVRAGGYPFFSDDDSPDDDPLERAFVAPAGILVLLPIWPVHAFAELVEHGLLYAGVALALLGGSVAAARPRGGYTAAVVALAGMMLAGLGSGSANGMQGTILLFASKAVIVPLLQKTGTGPFFGSERILRSEIAGRKMDLSPFFGVLLFGFGFCGQGMIFAALFSQPTTAFAGGVFVAAHVLVSFSIVRDLRLQNRPARPQVPVGLVAIAALTALIAAVHINPPAWPTNAIGPPFATTTTWPAHTFEFTALAILGAIGLTAGWMTRPGDVVSERPPSGFRRWLRGGFYLEELFLLCVVLPTRGIAQLCRFFEWFIIERLWDLPRRAPEWLARLGEPLQGGTVRMSLAAILLATAALLGVIVGL